MTRDRELAIIKEIIADGYDNIDVISFELDIPMVELLAIKRQVEREKNQIRNAEANARRAEMIRSESIQRMRTIT